MESELERARKAARRAYELGRLRASLPKAAVITAGAALLAALALGPRALLWSPVTLLVWAFVEWRGAWLREGARRGLVAGVAAIFLPLSILRPCCRIEDGASAASCGTETMPQACVVAGVLLGLSLAVLLPRAPSARRIEAAVGMALGVGSVAALRCAPLVLGEAIGLLGGLMAGVAAASVARAWVDRPRAA